MLTEWVDLNHFSPKFLLTVKSHELSSLSQEETVKDKLNCSIQLKSRLFKFTCYLFVHFLWNTFIMLETQLLLGLFLLVNRKQSNYTHPSLGNVLYNLEGSKLFDHHLYLIQQLGIITDCLMPTWWHYSSKYSLGTTVLDRHTYSLPNALCTP